MESTLEIMWASTEVTQPVPSSNLCFLPITWSPSEAEIITLKRVFSLFPGLFISHILKHITHTHTYTHTLPCAPQNVSRLLTPLCSTGCEQPINTHATDYRNATVSSHWALSLDEEETEQERKSCLGDLGLRCIHNTVHSNLGAWRNDYLISLLNQTTDCVLSKMAN